MLNLKSLLTKITDDMLFTSGGQLNTGGELLTSFQSESIIGSGLAAANTISALITEVNQLSVPTMGSVNITTEYMYSSTYKITIPAGWYNFVTYKTSATATSYSIILLGMTVSQANFIIHSASQITQIQQSIPIKGAMSNGTTTNYRLNGTSGTHYYYVRQGNLVTVNFNVYCASPASSYTNFASGLPHHKTIIGTKSGSGLTTQTYQIISPLSCEDTSVAPMSCMIDNNGNIYGAGGTAGKYYYGSIGYLACY